jgi:hypothetical protein
MHKFAFLEFSSERAMKQAINLWYEIKNKPTYKKTMKGYNYKGDILELYEANIPPLLRMFHIKDISPSGWIEVPRAKAKLIRTKIRFI